VIDEAKKLNIFQMIMLPCRDGRAKMYRHGAMADQLTERLTYETKLSSVSENAIAELFM